MKTHAGYLYRSLAVQGIGHLLLLLVLQMLLSAPAAGAGGSTRLSDSEAGRRLMVNYIVHFAHHLQWPIEVFNGTGAPFRICVMGAEALTEPLTGQLKYHRVDGRAVEVRELAPDEKLEARRCQILVLGPIAPAQFRDLTLALEYFSVLTVSDVEGFTTAGGMIGFTGFGAGVSVSLNKTALDHSDLKIGNSLFRLTKGRR
ncbi:YfiR family protein [Microbulbifer yueqingensis]|uniref:DUF4154 domain-containing protein n=1 Tax=Microbulbifer yueqingensis TaxID=658219 RepID=A0A1G8XRA4_9GAMM|nr:YfiR family protein [Microbulbifer yueqingensis]SDJ92310.1 protein of unknown function [Microbulbifer yueqingensis]